MKIAIPAAGDNMKSRISNRLGRSSYIIIYDTESKKDVSYANPGKNLQDGSGLKAVNLIINSGADMLLSMEVGMKAYSVLSRAHIDIHLLKTVSSVEKAVKNFLKNK